MKALLLDLDDTLLDYSGGVEASWEAACATCVDGVVDHATLLQAIAHTREWFWADPHRHRRERVNMLGAWTNIVSHALARCGVRGDGLARAVAEEYAARRRAAMRLFPDALDCLTALRARGVPLALVTNGDAGQQRDKIERHGLGGFFDAVVIEGEFGMGKPEAAVYRAALDALGVAPSPQVWMAGDHIDFDVAGPQRLGLRAAWLDRPGLGVPEASAVRPDRIIRALAELTS